MGSSNLLGGSELDPTLYNKSARGQNGVSDVWVSASVQQIFDVDTATQTFGIDAWINCLYFDPKVQSEPQNYRKGEYIAEDAQKEKLTWDYYPVFHLMNNRGDCAVVDYYCLIYSEPAVGSVLVSKRIVGHFFSPANVHAFPFDEHRLDLKIFFNSCYKVRRSQDMPTGAFGQLLNNEWKIRPTVHEQLESLVGASGVRYTNWTLSLDVERESASWITNVLLPTSILTLFGGFTMLMENVLSERLGAVITLMLTQAALKLVLSANVPKVSYLTTMDRFVIASFALISLAGLEASLVGAQFFQDEFEWDTQFIDRAAFGVYMIGWFLLHPYIYWAVRRARKAAATDAHEMHVILSEDSKI